MVSQPLPSHVPAHLVREFDIYAPPGVENDFHGAWASLVETDAPPLLWTPCNGGHWLPTRSALVAEVLQDYQRFSSRCILIPKAHAEDHGLIPTTIDPPEHHRYRVTLTRSLAAPAVKAMEASIRTIVAALVDGLSARGSCNFTRDFAEILPIRIFLAMMDLPEADAARTKAWADQLIRPDGSMPFAEAMGHLIDYITPFVDARRGADGGDMLSRLVNTPVDGACLSRDESIRLVVQVLIAGIDTVVNLLGFVFLFLARNPDQQQQLRSGEVSCATAVEDILRRFPLVTIAREVREDTVFHGTELKAGDMVAAPTPLAALDERFSAPAAEMQSHCARVDSLTFGKGAHICPGKHLARSELRIALEEWLQRIPPFRLPAGYAPSFTSGIVGVVDELLLEW